MQVSLERQDSVTERKKNKKKTKKYNKTKQNKKKNKKKEKEKKTHREKKDSFYQQCSRDPKKLLKLVRQ